MKTYILVLSTLLAVASLAQAEVGPEDQIEVKRTSVGHQNLSKRPYAAPVNEEKFEGANIKEEEVVVDKKHQPLRLHMLGRLPYMERTVD